MRSGVIGGGGADEEAAAGWSADEVSTGREEDVGYEGAEPVLATIGWAMGKAG